MAVGDAANAKGMPLVPDTGEDGLVRYGAREINRTRDLVAATQDMIPTGPAGFQEASGISFGTGAPDNADGNDGDIYLDIIG